MDLLNNMAGNWFAVVLLLMGIGLVTVEMFMPGIGIPGIVGAICLIIGVIIASGSLLEALMLIIGIMLILGLALLLAVHSAKKGRLSRSPLVLNDSTSREQGYTSSVNLEEFVGKTGVALSVLRPAGVALVNGERLDVVTEGAFLPKEAVVCVARVEGNRVIVRPAQLNAQDNIPVADEKDNNG